MRRTVIESLPQAWEIIKEMRLSEDYESDYRVAGRQSLRQIIDNRE